MLEVIEEKAAENTTRIIELENKKVTLVQLINDLQKHINQVQIQLQTVDEEIYKEIRMKNNELQNEISVNQTDILDLKDLTRYFKIEDVVDGAVPNILDVFALKTRIINLTNEMDQPYIIIDDVLELLSHYISIEDLSEYVSKDDLTVFALKSDLPDLSPYALTSSLTNYVLTTSLTNYAKKTDLSPYALTTSLTSYAKKTDLNSYALTTSLTKYALTTSLTNYAKKTDLSPYALTTSLTSYAKKTDLNSYYKKTDLGILQEVGSDYDLGYLTQVGSIPSHLSYSVEFLDQYGNEISSEDVVDPEYQTITYINFFSPRKGDYEYNEKLYLYFGREAKQSKLLGYFYLNEELYLSSWEQTSQAHTIVDFIEFDERLTINYNKHYEFLMVSSKYPSNSYLFCRPNSLKTKIMSAEYCENNYVRRSDYNALLSRVQALEALA